MQFQGVFSFNYFKYIIRKVWRLNLFKYIMRKVYGVSEKYKWCESRLACYKSLKKYECTFWAYDITQDSVINFIWVFLLGNNSRLSNSFQRYRFVLIQNQVLYLLSLCYFYSFLSLAFLQYKYGNTLMINATYLHLTVVNTLRGNTQLIPYHFLMSVTL